MTWALISLFVAAATPPMKMPGATLHVYVHEALNADSLRALARPEAILWVDAEGQVLRESTVDTLTRANDAWLKVNLPVSEVLARQMQRALKVGIWLSIEPSEDAGLYRLGPRKMAFSNEGLFTEATIAALQKYPPSVLYWMPGADISLLDFGWLAQLPGQKWVRWTAGPSRLPVCGEWVSHQVGWRVEASYLRKHPDFQTPCSTSLRIQLDGVPGDEWLKRWIVKYPGVTWEFFVGADEARARRALAILKRFEELSR